MTVFSGRGGFLFLTSQGVLIPGTEGRLLKVVNKLSDIIKQYLSTGHRWPDGKVEIHHVPVKESGTIILLH